MVLLTSVPESRCSGSALHDYDFAEYRKPFSSRFVRRAQAWCIVGRQLDGTLVFCYIVVVEKYAYKAGFLPLFLFYGTARAGTGTPGRLPREETSADWDAVVAPFSEAALAISATRGKRRPFGFAQDKQDRACGRQAQHSKRVRV
jgi:hypothetical protein